MQAQAQFCKVEDLPGGYGYGGMGGASGYGYGGMMASRPNTRMSMYGGVQAPANGTPTGLQSNRPNPCADIPAGSAISMHGEEWEQVPIDFLGAGRTLSPQVEQMVSAIEAYFRDE
jgi:hypothetical protein